MNFTTSTQLTQWRFTRPEVDAQRAAARQQFLARLVALPADADAPSATPAAAAASGAAASGETQVGSKRTASAMLAGSAAAAAAETVPSAADAAAAAAAAAAGIDKAMSIADEQVVLRSWMLHMDGKLCLPPGQGAHHAGPFVRATAWTFLRRFYLGRSLLEHDVEAVMAAALLLAAKVEEREDTQLPARIGQLIGQFDKRAAGAKLSTLQRRREMVDSELALVLQLRGCMVCYHPLSYLAPLCKELQAWLVGWHKKEGLPVETQKFQDMFGRIYGAAELFVVYTQWTDCDLLHPAPVTAVTAVHHAATHEFAKSLPGQQQVRLADQFVKSKNVGQMDFATLMKHMSEVSKLYHEGKQFTKDPGTIKAARKNLKKARKRVEKVRKQQQEKLRAAAAKAESAAVDADGFPIVGGISVDSAPAPAVVAAAEAAANTAAAP